MLVADHQTAGRGRLDRTWEAPPGASLLLSILTRPADPPRSLALDQLHLVSNAVGVAAAVAARRVSGVDVGLKWPNDLVIETADGVRKVSGILAETILVDGRADAARGGHRDQRQLAARPPAGAGRHRHRPEPRGGPRPRSPRAPPRAARRARSLLPRPRLVRGPGRPARRVPPAVGHHRQPGPGGARRRDDRGRRRRRHRRKATSWWSTSAPTDRARSWPATSCTCARTRDRRRRRPRDEDHLRRDRLPRPPHRRRRVPQRGQPPPGDPSRPRGRRLRHDAPRLRRVRATGADGGPRLHPSPPGAAAPAAVGRRRRSGDRVVDRCRGRLPRSQLPGPTGPRRRRGGHRPRPHPAALPGDVHPRGHPVPPLHRAGRGTGCLGPHRLAPRRRRGARALRHRPRARRRGPQRRGLGPGRRPRPGPRARRRPSLRARRRHHRTPQGLPVADPGVRPRGRGPPRPAPRRGRRRRMGDRRLRSRPRGRAPRRPRRSAWDG